MFILYLGLVVAGIAYFSGDRAGAQLTVRAFVKHNGLSVAFLGLFVAALVFQAIAGQADFNEDQDRHGDPRISLGRYVTSSEFGVAVMENCGVILGVAVLLDAARSPTAAAGRPAPARPGRMVDAAPAGPTPAGLPAPPRRIARSPCYSPGAAPRMTVSP
jgi:hypothetical protein